MKVKNAKFITSGADPAQTQAYAPQIAVAGRSNCGKSSLLNMLMGAKLCKTSQTPGRTRLINIFEVNADTKFYFVDLPGYGFSKANRAETDDFGARAEKYFSSGNSIAQVLCLADIRRDPSELDKTLIDYVRNLELPFTVVLTKADKLSRAACASARIKISAALGLARDSVIVTSSASGLGKDVLLDRLGEILNNYE